MKTEAAVHHLRPNPATAYLKKSEQEHEAARRANTDGKSAGGRRASPNGTHPQANRQPGSKKAQQGATVAARKNDSTGVAVPEPLAGAISLPSSLRRAWRRSRRAPRSAGGADREEALRDPLVGVVSPPSSLRGATRRRAWSRGGWAPGSADGASGEEAPRDPLIGTRRPSVPSPRPHPCMEPHAVGRGVEAAGPSDPPVEKARRRHEGCSGEQAARRGRRLTAARRVWSGRAVQAPTAPGLGDGEWKGEDKCCRAGLYT